MPLSSQEAIGIAWCEFLYAVGEPVVSRFEVGFVAAYVCETATGRRCDKDEHWQIVFFDSRAHARSGGSPQSVASRVWVDKRTGHCNVWVNENYDPNVGRNVW